MIAETNLGRLTPNAHAPLLEALRAIAPLVTGRGALAHVQHGVGGPAPPGAARVVRPPLAQARRHARVAGDVVGAVGARGRLQRQVVPFVRPAALDLHAARLRLVQVAVQALARDLAPAARRVSQAGQTVGVLPAGAVLVRSQVLKGKHLGAFLASTVLKLHFRLMMHVHTNVFARFEVDKKDTIVEKDRLSRFPSSTNTGRLLSTQISDYFLHTHTQKKRGTLCEFSVIH